MCAQHRLTPEQEEHLNAVIARCMEREDQGLVVDPSQVMAEFPEIAEPLDVYFRDAAFLQSLVDTSRASSSVVDPARAKRVPDSPLPSTQRIAGRFDLVHRLGRGGMGSVFLAFDQKLQRNVALKFGNFFAGDSEERFQRFRIEAQALAQLHHSNICQVHDYGEHDEQPYIVMQYIDGLPLSKYIDSRRLQPILQTVQLIRKLALALEELHAKKIVHRDLKPLNIMVDRRGEPVIVDFGLARREEDPRLSRTGVAIGTPHYMAPEQIQGRVREIGPRTDIHALGVVFYQLLTGRLPYPAPSTHALIVEIAAGEPVPPCSHCADVPASLNAICLRMMAGPPESRFASMAEVAEALAPHCESTAADLHPSPAPSPDSQSTEQLPASESSRQDSFTPLDDQDVSISADALLDTPSKSQISTSESFTHASLLTPGKHPQLSESSQRRPLLRAQSSRRRIAVTGVLVSCLFGAIWTGVVLFSDAGEEEVKVRFEEDWPDRDYAVAIDKKEVQIKHPGDSTTVRLESGQVHRWSVSWISDGQQRSKEATFPVERGTDNDVTIAFDAGEAPQSDAVAEVTDPLPSDPDFRRVEWLPEGLADVQKVGLDSTCTRAVVVSQHSVKLYSTVTRRLIQTIHDTSENLETTNAALSKNGDAIAFAFGNEVRVWSVAQGAQIWQGALDRVFPDSNLENVEDEIRLCMSDDGTSLAIARRKASKPLSEGEKSGDWLIRVWETALPENAPHVAEFELADQVDCLAISPDGKSLAVGTHAGVLLRYALKGEQKPFEVPVSDGAEAVRCVNWSPDCKALATAVLRGNARIWDSTTGKLTRELPVTAVSKIAFSANGEFIATSSDEDRAIRFWNANTGERFGGQVTHAGNAEDFCFSPDGHYLMVACPDEALAWSLPTTLVARDGFVPLAMLVHPTAKIVSLAVSPDEKLLVASGRPLESGSPVTIRLWDLRSKALLHEIPADLRSVRRLRFCLDGSEIGAISDDGEMQFWETATAQPRGTPFSPGPSREADFDYLRNPEGAILVTARDGIVSFDRRTKHVTRIAADWKFGSPTVVRARSNGDVVSGFFFDQESRVRTGIAGAYLSISKPPFTDDAKAWQTASPQIDAIDASKDGRWLLSGGHGHFELWDADESLPRRVQFWDRDPRLGNYDQHCAAISPDGDRVLLVTSESGRSLLNLFDSTSTTPIAVAASHREDVEAAAFLSEGRNLVTGGCDQTVRLWQLPEPTDRDVLAASWVLSQGGEVFGKDANGQSFHQSEGELAAKSVALVRVVLDSDAAIPPQDFAALSNLLRLRDVRIAGDCLDADGLAHIHDLPRLEFLDLASTNLDDEALPHLAVFASLGHLVLRGTPITSAGVRHLVALQSLTSLDLGETAIDDAGIPFINALRGLSELYLNDTRITDEAVEELNLPRLQFLDVRKTQLSEKALARLRERFRNTRVVSE